MPDKPPSAKRKKVADAQQRSEPADLTPKQREVGPVANRDRHTDPDFEALLCEAEGRNWKVWRDDGYFKCRCACADKHYVGVVLTPSSSRTLMNTRKKFEGKSCW